MTDLIQAAVLLCALCVAAGCSSARRNDHGPGAPPSSAHKTPPDVRGFHRIYSRSNTWFTNAVVCKIADEHKDLPGALAPIILLESSTNMSCAASAIQAPGEVRAFVDSVMLAGQTRARIAYTWGNSATEQGVRITLGPGGEPVIWEVLRDSSGARIFFVAKSLEQKAAAQFGAPAPGRQFSLEPAPDLAPDVVVARVIEDGPVPMGPLVYVEPNGDIATLLCRCMPSQARSVASTETFHLVEASSSPFSDPAVAPLRLPSNW